MKILLLSAYDADSHQYWRQGLVDNFPEHQWSVLTLPGRYFSWRIRGNSMSWAFGSDAHILNQHFDLIVATSMTDLSALKGFIPSLANTKSIVYFHENQFAYPSTSNARENIEPKILNLYTALCADSLVFNSKYNAHTFFEGAQFLLKKLPDHIPANIIDILKDKSSIIPVPLKENNIVQQTAGLSSDQPNKTTENKPILIAWAARWEYDKGPDRLLSILKSLEAKNINYRLCIMGPKFRQIPTEFDTIKEEFKHRLDHFGYTTTKEEYFNWLAKADIFLSTAIHEFQGLSVLEAAHAHCIPVLPNRLVYPEIFDARYLYASSDNIKQEAEAAATLIAGFCEKIKLNEVLPPTTDFSWQALKPSYLNLFNKTLNTSV